MPHILHNNAFKVEARYDLPIPFTFFEEFEKQLLIIACIKKDTTNNMMSKKKLIKMTKVKYV